MNISMFSTQVEHYQNKKQVKISNPEYIPSDPLSNFSKKVWVQLQAATANPSFSRALSKDSLNASKVLVRKWPRRDW